MLRRSGTAVLRFGAPLRGGITVLLRGVLALLRGVAPSLRGCQPVASGRELGWRRLGVGNGGGAMGCAGGTGGHPGVLGAVAVAPRMCEAHMQPSVVGGLGG